MSVVDLQRMDPAEVTQLVYADTGLYGQVFFPRAVRQQTPAFHRDIDQLLDTEGNRHVAVAVFRGGAKTTKGRIQLSKRIAFGHTRTAFLLSRSQSHSLSSIEWLQRNVEYNRTWADFFRLRPGKKWAGDQIEIIHEGLGYTIRVIAGGITGQVRGFNFEDYRPDYIVLDDIDDEETTGTFEQRQKTEHLVHGAVANSLTPASENPHSQMVFFQTPLHVEDQLMRCMRDPQWVTARFSVFDEAGQSRWPDRWSTAELQKMKEGYVARNLLHVWMREMECSLVSAETKAFRIAWLKYWTVLPEEMVTYIAVDPAASDAKRADFQAVVVIGVHEKNVYLLDYTVVRGQDPEELIDQLFQFHQQYRPRLIGVEGGSYQKTLKWYIDQWMRRSGYFMSVAEVLDRRSKAQRIRDTIRDLAFNGRIFVRADHSEFIQDFGDFEAAGDGGLAHDDLLDAFSMAVRMINPYETGMASELPHPLADQRNRVRDRNWRTAP